MTPAGLTLQFREPRVLWVALGSSICLYPPPIVRNLCRLTLAVAGMMASVVSVVDAAERRAGVKVVAPAPQQVASNTSAAFLTPPPVASRPAGRLSLGGQKYGAPFTFSRRTEAGVSWALDSRVSIQLNYERTSQAPMMPFDHDDGIMTRLRVGF